MVHLAISFLFSRIEAMEYTGLQPWQETGYAVGSGQCDIGLEVEYVGHRVESDLVAPQVVRINGISLEEPANLPPFFSNNFLDRSQNGETVVLRDIKQIFTHQ